MQTNITSPRTVVAAPRPLNISSPVTSPELQTGHGNATSLFIGLEDETTPALPSGSSTITQGLAPAAGTSSKPPASNPSTSSSNGPSSAANNTSQGHSTLLNTPIFGSLTPLVFTNTTYNTTSGTKPLGSAAALSPPPPAILDPGPFDYQQRSGPIVNPTVFFSAVMASLTKDMFSEDLQVTHLL